MRAIFAIFLFVFITVVRAQEVSKSVIQPIFSGYLNLGTSLPSGELRSKSKSFYPYSFGKMDHKTLSYNLVGNWYAYKNFGISAGFGNTTFEVDSSGFTKIYTDKFPENHISTYTPLKYKMFVLLGGFSWQRQLNHIIIEPRLMFGAGSFRTDYFDIYVYDQHYNAVKIIEYSKGYNFNFYTKPSLNACYMLNIIPGIKTGVQLSCEYTFTVSSFKYYITTTDIVNHTVTEEEIHKKPYLGSWNISGGLVFWIDCNVALLRRQSQNFNQK